MPNVIVHPTDFSDCARSAQHYAESLCLELNAELMLVHAIDLNKLAGYDQSGRSLLSRSNEIKEEARQKISTLGDSAAKKGIASKARIYQGDLTQCLPKLCEETETMMIVMGTTGAGTWSNSIFGSTTYAVVQSAHIPVLAIPDLKSHKMSSRMLLATDLGRSDFNFGSIDFLSKLAAGIDAELDLVYVPESSAQAFSIEAIRSTLKQKGYADLSLDLAEGDDHIKAIQTYLNDHETDLFAMIVSEKSMLEKFIFGSLSKKMLHHSKIPVLMIPRSL